MDEFDEKHSYWTNEKSCKEICETQGLYCSGSYLSSENGPCRKDNKIACDEIPASNKPKHYNPHLLCECGKFNISICLIFVQVFKVTSAYMI